MPIKPKFFIQRVNLHYPIYHLRLSLLFHASSALICIYIYISSIYIYIYILYIYIYILYIYIYIYIYIYKYELYDVYAICLYTSVCMLRKIYKYINIYTYVCVYIYICIFKYIYIYIHIISWLDSCRAIHLMPVHAHPGSCPSRRPRIHSSSPPKLANDNGNNVGPPLMLCLLVYKHLVKYGIYSDLMGFIVICWVYKYQKLYIEIVVINTNNDNNSNSNSNDFRNVTVKPSIIWIYIYI